MGQQSSRVRLENLESVPNDDSESRAAVTSLTKTLISSGCEAKLVEDAASGALLALGVTDTVVQVQPNSVTFVSRAETWAVMAPPGLSINKAEESAAPLLRVAHSPGKYNSTYLAAHAARLAALDALYPLWMQFAAWAVLSSACTVVFHHGSWPNVLLTFISSLFTFVAAAVVPILSSKLSFASGFLAGFVSGFIAKTAASINLLHPACVKGVVLSAIIGIVPGAGITYGIVDVTQGNLVCGVSRLVGALVQASLQGFGITVGWYVAAWYQYPATVVNESAVCPDPVSNWFLFLFIPMVWFGWCVLLDCRFSRWPVYCFASLISQLFGALLPPGLPSFTVVLVSSLTVGIFAALCSRFSQHRPGFGIVLVGIFSLLPGGGAVWNAVSAIVELPAVAGSSSSSILPVAVQIAAGLSLADFFNTTFVCEKKRQGTAPGELKRGLRRVFMR